jgi:protein involved in polysaccharide export with SLBB domain
VSAANPAPRFLLLLSILLLAVPAPRIGAQEPGADRSTAANVADATVRPGDQVNLRIFREPEMSGTYAVSESGELVLPRLGRVAVTELTPQALQDSLVAAYARYLRNPSIEIAVLRRISVHGEVRRPDVYMVDLTTSVQDLIARAGGVTDAGNPNRITILRDGSEVRTTSGSQAGFQAADLRSGDQVVVGRRSWLSINALGVVSTAAVAVSVFVPLIRSLIS